jgi:hypothetical protein
MPEILSSLTKIKNFRELRWLPKQYRDPIIANIAEVRVQAFKDSIKDIKGAESLTDKQIEILAMSTDAAIHIRKDGKINVNGIFDCSELGLTSLHGLKLGKIKGEFRCSNNAITNLEGFPTENPKGSRCNFYRNRGVSPETLMAIHKIMIDDKVDYWRALCIAKSDCENRENVSLAFSMGIDDLFNQIGDRLTPEAIKSYFIAARYRKF